MKAFDVEREIENYRWEPLKILIHGIIAARATDFMVLICYYNVGHMTHCIGIVRQHGIIPIYKTHMKGIHSHNISHTAKSLFNCTTQNKGRGSHEGPLSVLIKTGSKGPIEHRS